MDKSTFTPHYDLLRERLVELREAVGDDLADIGDQPRTGNAELDAFAAKMEKRQAEMQAALRAKEEGE
jgi:hypothetical protein